MKKTIAILLVAILAVVSSVFAAFSGEAKIGFGGNLDNGEFGFIDKSSNVKFDVDLATADAEAIADGDIYASIKATFALKLTTGEKKYAEGDPYFGIASSFGAFDDGNVSLAVIADITEAKVAGENWYVSILGLSDAPNFAESAIDTYTVEEGYDKYGMPREDFDKAYNYGVAFEKAPGVEVGVFDYVFGVGLLGDYDDDKNANLEDKLQFSLYAKTPEYNFGGVIAQFGGVYSYKGKTAAEAADPKNAIGLSGKVGFANDTLSATVATDVGFNLEEKGKDAFDMDLAANFNWSFLTVDAYYATTATTGETPAPKYENIVDSNGDITGIYVTDWDNTVKETTEDVLSFQTKFDLNAFNVPVALTASVKDVLKTVELGVKAEVTAIENLTITANAGYVINTIDAYDKDLRQSETDVFMGQWKVGADVEYDFGFAKVSGGIEAKNLGASKIDSLDDRAKLSEDVLKESAKKDNPDNYLANQVILGVSLGVETDSIIPGATLAVKWENADDLLGIYKYNADTDTYNYGKITASCKIAF